MFTVKNKVALITGGSGGIAADLAKVLLRHNLKAVSLIDIDENKAHKVLREIEAEFGKNRAIFLKVDVSNRVQFDEAFQRTVDTFKQLDIVINNAGIIQEIDWQSCINVNLIGTMIGSTLAMEKYLPLYKSGDDAVILNVSSVAGVNHFEYVPAYVASKHGVLGYSRSIGSPLHYKLFNVRVVTICPDGTDTTIVKFSEKQVKEPFLSAYFKVAEKISLQSTIQLAEHAVTIIENGASGSAWMVRNNISTEIPGTHY